MKPACDVVVSTIMHTRHGAPKHVLRRRGLSLWIDLDRLEEAGAAARLFSVDGFNLLSFRQHDYGPNFKGRRKSENRGNGVSGKVKKPVSLAAYARDLARKIRPEIKVSTVHLLTFPRILGVAFNPVSVYVLGGADGRDVFYIYEVRNTFGDMHSYAGAADDEGASSGSGRGAKSGSARRSGRATKAGSATRAGSTRAVRATVLEAEKIFHVSPFFDVDGEYRLMFRKHEEKGEFRVLMRYASGGEPRLTATMRGERRPLGDMALLRALAVTRQWPMRPLVSIHFEALRLWLKGATYFKRPSPPQAVSKARNLGEIVKKSAR